MSGIFLETLSRFTKLTLLDWIGIGIESANKILTPRSLYAKDEIGYNVPSSSR
jgi:hypothetical protein